MEPSKSQEEKSNQYTASQLITQIQEESKSAGLDKTDPVAFLERELKIKFDADTRDQLNKSVSDVDSYKEKVSKLLETLKKKYEGNYKVQRAIDNLIPLYDAHDFWDSQPVPKAYDSVDPSSYDKPIDVHKTVEEIRNEPYNLPAGFYWSDIDISNREQADEVYQLLTQNYVEDDDNMFRFDYSIEFLQWALTPPGYHKEWLFGVRGGKKNKLFGFISGIPIDCVVRGKKMKMAEINFLCVHKSLRAKRLATVLIKEVTRRVNKHDIWQALYTAGVLIPLPISKTTYWHRSLNPKKLVDVGFSSLPANTPMARYVKLLKLPSEVSIKGLRPMVKKDVKAVHELLQEYMKKFEVHLHFSPQEIEHFLLPREGVIDSFVVENPDTGKVTDFISYYHLPSSILKHEVHKVLKVAYSYYNVATSHSLLDLMKDALVLAKQKEFDVFNALDIQDNEQFLKELKFGIGDGNLHYYLYNWRVPELKPSQLGVVLV